MGDTVTAGAAAGLNNGVISVLGASFVLNDGGFEFHDTITGFNQNLGDRIHLAAGDTLQTSALVNGNQDTLITLSDSSTILLKGVTQIDHVFDAIIPA